MRQKTIWTIFLTFGISLMSCKENKIIDYAVNLNFVFVNNTKYTINFNEKANVLNVAPFSKSKYSKSTDGPQELTKESFRVSPMQSLCNTCIVYFNSTNCDTLKGRGIEDINNFEFTKIKQGEYELRYIFTETDYLSSKKCN
jgi:hypothetical protein